MLKETETEETTGFLVTFLSLVAFQLGAPRPSGPPGYVYDPKPSAPQTNLQKFEKKIQSSLYNCSVTAVLTSRVGSVFPIFFVKV